MYSDIYKNIASFIPNATNMAYAMPEHFHDLDNLFSMGVFMDQMVSSDFIARNPEVLHMIPEAMIVETLKCIRGITNADKLLDMLLHERLTDFTRVYITSISIVALSETKRAIHGFMIELLRMTPTITFTPSACKYPLVQELIIEDNEDLIPGLIDLIGISRLIVNIKEPHQRILLMKYAKNANDYFLASPIGGPGWCSAPIPVRISNTKDIESIQNVYEHLRSVL